MGFQRGNTTRGCPHCRHQIRHQPISGGGQRRLETPKRGERQTTPLPPRPNPAGTHGENRPAPISPPASPPGQCGRGGSAGRAAPRPREGAPARGPPPGPAPGPPTTPAPAPGPRSDPRTTDPRTPAQPSLTAGAAPPARPGGAGAGRARQATSFPARPARRARAGPEGREPREEGGLASRPRRKPPPPAPTGIIAARVRGALRRLTGRSASRRAAPAAPAAFTGRAPAAALSGPHGEAAAAAGCGAWPALSWPPARCVAVSGPVVVATTSARPPPAASPRTLLSPRRPCPQRVAPHGASRPLRLARLCWGRVRGGWGIRAPPAQPRSRPRPGTSASAFPRAGGGGAGVLRKLDCCPARRDGLWAPGRAGPRSRTLANVGHGKTEVQRRKGPAGAPQRVTVGPRLEPQLREAGGGGAHPVATARAPAFDRVLTPGSRRPVGLQARGRIGRVWVRPKPCK